jgi:hypothetical protein
MLQGDWQRALSGTPPAVILLTDLSGHALGVELKTRITECTPTSGSEISLPLREELLIQPH